jgi:hypothetical protein
MQDGQQKSPAFEAGLLIFEYSAEDYWTAAGANFPTMPSSGL